MFRAHLWRRFTPTPHRTLTPGLHHNVATEFAAESQIAKREATISTRTRGNISEAVPPAIDCQSPLVQRLTKSHQQLLRPNDHHSKVKVKFPLLLPDCVRKVHGGMLNDLLEHDRVELERSVTQWRSGWDRVLIPAQKVLFLHDPY